MGTKTDMISDPYFNYSCRTQTGLGNVNVLLLSFLLVFLGASIKLLIALGLTANLCALYLSANKQVGRDFYLDAADERKGHNEKMEMEMEMESEEWERRNRRRKERKALEERRGATSVWPSLHYITEMLQH